MAEAAGFVLAAAGLVSSCLDAFELIQKSRSFGITYEILITKLDIEKTKLLQWADGVGLLAENPAQRNERLNSDTGIALVKQILKCIRHLLTSSEELKQRYGLRQCTDAEATTSSALTSTRRTQLFRKSYARLRAKSNGQSAEIGVIRRTKWAIEDRDKFEKLITDLKDFINGLNEIVPVKLEHQVSMVKEDVGQLPGDLQTLRILESACSGQSDSWSDEISLRVEATRMATEDHRNIQEWLDDIQEGPPVTGGGGCKGLRSVPIKASGQSWASTKCVFTNQGQMFQKQPVLAIQRPSSGSLCDTVFRIASEARDIDGDWRDPGTVLQRPLQRLLQRLLHPPPLSSLHHRPSLSSLLHRPSLSSPLHLPSLPSPLHLLSLPSLLHLLSLPSLLHRPPFSSLLHRPSLLSNELVTTLSLLARLKLNLSVTNLGESAILKTEDETECLGLEKLCPITVCSNIINNGEAKETCETPNSLFEKLKRNREANETSEILNPPFKKRKINREAKETCEILNPLFKKRKKNGEAKETCETPSPPFKKWKRNEEPDEDF